MKKEEKKKKVLSEAILEIAVELAVTLICLGIGIGVAKLFNIEVDGENVDFDLLVLLGIFTVAIIFVGLYIVAKIFKKTSKHAERVEVFEKLPDAAKSIRATVFIEEQGFIDEWDEIDDTAHHLVMFKSDEPISTCRIFKKDDTGVYFIGRLAVLKKHRGQGVGWKMLIAAEEYVREVGGSEIRLHSQCAAESFYEKCGYIPYGDVDYEEDCPHIWMKKTVKTQNQGDTKRYVKRKRS